jgi:molybdenum-dependent DNA-binding transcriptional regulator ModE
MRCFKTPLVETSAGGGARISTSGTELLQRYRALETATTKIMEKGFGAIKPLLRNLLLSPAASE